MGLTDEDREKIQLPLPTSSDVTLCFLRIPSENPLVDMGVVWAKISMVPVLPVERVLYLDADILVRADLRELWNTDLKGKPLDVVVDIGYPMGHEEIARAPYFNAGVLLMDLAQIRENLDGLFRVAREMKDAKYHDQDALNTYFIQGWMSMPMKWNAQGMGTYAECPTPERDALGLEEMKEAAIVHFTGAVHPGMEHVLNPYFQPYPAKPWGYAGAPGHPFANAWWKELERTAWGGWKASDEYQEACSRASDEAMKKAIAEFKNKIENIALIL